MSLTFKELPAVTLTAVWRGRQLLGRIRPTIDGGHRFDGSSGSATLTADELRAIADRIDALDAAKAR